MAHLLLVEDEAAIARPLVDLLSGRGHTVVHAASGDEGLAQALAAPPDALLLDVMLPGVDGLEICRRVRERHRHLGILMLTARGSESDILAGFEAGADDYVPKPFSVAQLLARLAALLRRIGAVDGVGLALGALRLDAEALRLEGDGAACDLLRRDAEILTCLARAGSAIVSRERLLSEVWGYTQPEAVETRCVDMHLVKLRRRLAAAFGTVGEQLIETVRGEGYRLRAP